MVVAKTKTSFKRLTIKLFTMNNTANLSSGYRQQTRALVDVEATRKIGGVLTGQEHKFNTIYTIPYHRFQIQKFIIQLAL